MNLYHPPDEDYLPFQVIGIESMLSMDNVLLADEMGLGKTIQIIGYINASRPAKVLIVCPNSLRRNWISECEKWLDPELLEKYGEIEQCTSAAFFPSDFVVASYEGFTKWSVVLKNEVWDVVIFDEAHLLKNRSTKRASAAALFNDFKGKKIMATGTPICNYPYEIFPLIHWLDQEQWPSASSFERRYCPYANKYGYHLPELQDFLRNGTWKSVSKKVRSIRANKMVHSNSNVYECPTCDSEMQYADDATRHVEATEHTVYLKKIVTEKIVPLVDESYEQIAQERAQGLMIRRLKKEVLPELPKKRRQVIELPAEGELLDLVEKENDLWNRHKDIQLELDKNLELITADSDGSFASVVENLKFTKQYFFEEIALIRHALARAKVPYVIEHLENILENKDKIVVGIHHRDVGEAILEAFSDKAVLVYGAIGQDALYERKDRFWNDDKCQLFIGSLKVAGIGLNLQVASNIVFAELDWVPGVITQFEDRCHRIGQENPLLIQHLVAQNSMDSYMAKKIIAKQKSINVALNKEVKT